MTFNEVILVGYVGSVEFKELEGGNNVLNFSIATSQSWKVGEEWKERTDWHNVNVFGKLAENLKDKISKGRRVLVTGELRTDTYEDNDGNKKTFVSVRANKVKAFFDKKTGEASEPEDDDVPF